MRPILLAAATIFLAAVANAQAQQPKPISRADYVKTVDARFNALDAHRDRKGTKEEQAAEQARERQQAKAKIAQQLQAKFKQLDTNKDGQLSLQEFMAAAPPIRTSETADQMVARYDANHDGRISADEWRNPELAKFNRVDANHDGVVTPAEQAAARSK